MPDQIPVKQIGRPVAAVRADTERRVSVALDTWHVAYRAEETQLHAMQRVVAALDAWDLDRGIHRVTEAELHGVRDTESDLRAENDHLRRMWDAASRDGERLTLENRNLRRNLDWVRAALRGTDEHPGPHCEAAVYDAFDSEVPMSNGGRVEAAARAIYEMWYAAHGGVSWSDVDELGQDEYRRVAGRVLAAADTADQPSKAWPDTQELLNRLNIAEACGSSALEVLASSLAQRDRQVRAAVLASLAAGAGTPTDAEGDANG